MDNIKRIKNLTVPSGKIDVVLDTDTFNEIDDQFAIAYMLASKEKLNVAAITAAPFFNENSASPSDGMEKSYKEILKILELADRTDLNIKTFKGSNCYLNNEKEAVISDAANEIVRLALEHTSDYPLYIVAIGAITNVASAILINPLICERIVIVWLGGNAVHWDHTQEFNMQQDIAAARVVFGSGAPLVQLPCMGVVNTFATSEFELRHWLVGKNKLATYLAENAISAAEKYAKGKPWTRIIWDVTAVAWLINDNDRFMNSRLIPAPIPEYDNYYSFDSRRHFIRYVHFIKRDELFADLFNKISKYGN